MPHSRSAKKELRKSRQRRAQNKALNSALRTQVKKVLQGEVEDPAAELAQAQKLLDKAAKARRMHPNKAARLKSRLTRKTQAKSRPT